MSIKGYFESCLNAWHSAKKITPAMRSDMKTVMNQFNNTLYYEELTEEEYRELHAKFHEIYKEVYK